MKKLICLLATVILLSAIMAAAQPVMSVKITSPAPGTHFAQCSDIVVTVDPQIQNGEIQRVILYRNNISLSGRIKAPWEFKMIKSPPGYYVLKAQILAKTGESVYSDPVAVYVGDAEKGNILINGGFDCNQNPWTLTDNDGSIATFETDTAAKIFSGPDAMITIAYGGPADFSLWLGQPVAVDSGHTYIISFTAQSDQSALMNIGVVMDEEPWTQYNPGASATVDLLQEYGPFVFESPATKHDGVHLRLTLGNFSNATVWIDNVTMFDANDTSQTGLNERKPLKTDALPSRSLLSQNYPNPFNPGTTIQYRIPERGDVTLALYNMKGQEIRTLVRENQSPGDHLARWNGENESGERVPSGVYLYRLTVKTEDRTSTLSRKIMKLE